ncbi:MAG TPA: 2-oxo acid dehydrogenase subunit E2, partial [Gammaproteobacteria bacterium]
MADVKQITVPDIGDFEGVEVIEILVAAGDTVVKEQSLLTLESDKASIEIPSPDAGVIQEIKIKVGDKVSQGDLVMTLEATAAPAPKPKEKLVKPEPQKPQPTSPPQQIAAAVKLEEKPAATVIPDSGDNVQRPPPLPPIKKTVFNLPHASPSVRRFAHELGADLNQINGSGPKNRILKQDVQNYVKRILTGDALPGVSPPPQVDFAAFGAIEIQALSKINKLTGKYLHSSWFHIPHVTQFDEADITELETLRKKISAEHGDKGVKITLVAFLVKAAVAALREFPRFNASLDTGGESLVLKKYFHIGIAVDTPDGLTVPVIRDANKKTTAELAAEIADVAERARQKKIRPHELQGGCFTISSLGGIG